MLKLLRTPLRPMGLICDLLNGEMSTLTSYPQSGLPPRIQRRQIRQIGNVSCKETKLGRSHSLQTNRVPNGINLTITPRRQSS